jgi:hypothetical protein
VNIARNKVYNQSTTHPYPLSAPSSQAANGNTDGDYPGNCIHTAANSPQGWWQVDLGGYYTIYTLKVWGRTSGMYCDILIVGSGDIVY